MYDVKTIDNLMARRRRIKRWQSERRQIKLKGISDMRLRKQKYHYRDPQYINGVDKIHKHIGAVICVCREQAEISVDNAKYDLLKAKVHVAEMEIAYEFNHRIHSMLECGASAEEVIAVYGDFEAFQIEYLASVGRYKWSKEICAMIDKDGYWWRH